MSSTPAPNTGEYLTFTLGDEHYGVDILKVQEIRGYDSVTRVPDAPEYIKGVINRSPRAVREVESTGGMQLVDVSRPRSHADYRDRLRGRQTAPVEPVLAG